MYQLLILLSFIAIFTSNAAEPAAVRLARISESLPESYTAYTSRVPVPTDELTVRIPDALSPFAKKERSRMRPEHIFSVGMGAVAMGYAAPYLSEMFTNGIESCFGMVASHLFDGPSNILKLMGLGTCAAYVAWYWPKEYGRRMNNISSRQRQIEGLSEDLRRAQITIAKQVADSQRSINTSMHQARYSVGALSAFSMSYSSLIKSLNNNYCLIEGIKPSLLHRSPSVAQSIDSSNESINELNGRMNTGEDAIRELQEASQRRERESKQLIDGAVSEMRQVNQARESSLQAMMDRITQLEAQAKSSFMDRLPKFPGVSLGSSRPTPVKQTQPQQHPLSVPPREDTPAHQDPIGREQDLEGHDRQ